MDLYLDESGDLGFRFDKPFRKGGSSRYLTFSFLLVPDQLAHLPKRLVRKLYRRKRQPAEVEIKGRDLTSGEKAYFAHQTADLLTQKPQMKCFSITINKRTVKAPLQRDMGRLFRHVSRMGVMERIKGAERITFIPNHRSIKTGSSDLLADSIQAELWFEFDSDAVIENRPQESTRELNLQFTDWLGHIIWKKYEDNEAEAYDILKKEVDITPWWETLSQW